MMRFTVRVFPTTGYPNDEIGGDRAQKRLSVIEK